LLFSISCSGDTLDLHSFPTRRSSDLLVLTSKDESVNDDVRLRRHVEPICLCPGLDDMAVSGVRPPGIDQKHVVDRIVEEGICARSEERRVGKEGRCRWRTDV